MDRCSLANNRPIYRPRHNVQGVYRPYQLPSQDLCACSRRQQHNLRAHICPGSPNRLQDLHTASRHQDGRK